MDVSYNAYGTYTEENTNSQGSFDLNIPDGQSVAGVAFTEPEGKIKSEGGAGSTSVEYIESVASGVPAMGMLDSATGVSSAKTTKNLILVGGPAVNALTKELAGKANSTVWGLDTWTDGEHKDMAQIALVKDAFTKGNAALLVAGHEAEDTRAAAKVLANSDNEAYADLFTENTTEITLSKSEYTTAWSN